MFGMSRSQCHVVARVLQDYLDGEADDLTATMVAKHLEICRMCGLEANTYEAIKAALLMPEPDAAPLDPDAVERLRAFADTLTQRRD